jgi:hypothetical protein
MALGFNMEVVMVKIACRSQTSVRRWYEIGAKLAPRGTSKSSVEWSIYSPASCMVGYKWSSIPLYSYMTFLCGWHVGLYRWCGLVHGSLYMWTACPRDQEPHRFSLAVLYISCSSRGECGCTYVCWFQWIFFVYNVAWCVPELYSVNYLYWH